MLGAAGRWPSYSEPAVVSMVWMRRRSSYESPGSGLRLLWTVGPKRLDCSLWTAAMRADRQRSAAAFKNSKRSLRYGSSR